MKRTLTENEKQEIYNEIKQYLSDELEVDINSIQDETNIIDDLGADSILFLEMFEEFKTKLKIDLEIRVIGQYMLNHPVYTFREIIDAIYLFCEKGDELIEAGTET